MLGNKRNAGMAPDAKATQEVAGPLALTVQDRGVKDPNELDTVFAVMTKDRPDGFLALMDPVLNSYRKRIIDFLAQNDCPRCSKTVTGSKLAAYIVRPQFSCGFPSRRRSDGQSPQGNDTN
jgi:hypothetical protein